MLTDRITLIIDDRLGYYSMDAGLPITAGTWTGVQDSADVFLTGGQLLASGLDKAFFALCCLPVRYAVHYDIENFRHLDNAVITAQYLVCGS